MSIPVKCLEAIWNKAAKYWECHAPAIGRNLSAKVVQSYIGQMPHWITPKKGADFGCDSSCAHCKAMGICSHCVEVADINGKLTEFLSKNAKKAGTITKLLIINMSRPWKEGRNCISVKEAITISYNKGWNEHVTYQSCQYGNVRSNTTNSHVATDPQSSTSSHAYGAGMVPTSSLYHDPLLGVGYPVPPSPYLSYRPQALLPFSLSYIAGDISACFGCKRKYPKTQVEEEDLCMKHEEWHQRMAPSSSTPESNFGNVYCHYKVECVRMWHRHFQPWHALKSKVDWQLPRVAQT